MGNINRYDVAQPAKDNYFNTFVPLPLDQLTALGMARQEELKKNQEYVDKMYDNMLDIKYIKDSPYEEKHYRDITGTMNDIATKYATLDLSDPTVLSEFRREMRTKIDPTLVNRLEESYAKWAVAQDLRANLKKEGRYNSMLDEDPASSWDSDKQGVYGYMPDAYLGRENLLEPYFKHLKPSYKGINKDTGLIEMSIDQNDLNRTINSRSSELIQTPAGQQEIKLFRKQYGEATKNMSDVDIMNTIMQDYSEQYKQKLVDALPEGYLKMYGYGQKASYAGKLQGSNAADIQRFDRISDVTSKIAELKANGNEEAAKDLQIALEDYSKEFNVDITGKEAKEKEGPIPIPKFAHTLMEKFYPEEYKDYGERHGNEQKLLDKLSTMTSTKYSFGMPHYDSGSLSQAVNPSTGEKLGTFDPSMISNNLIAHPNSYEILEIDGEKAPKNSKLADKISGIKTSQMIDISIGATPTSNNEYKPDITFSYQDTDGKVRSIRALINDDSQVMALAESLSQRGDHKTAMTLLQPSLAREIQTTSFDNGKPHTYYMRSLDDNGNKIGEDKVEIKRNSDVGKRSTFDIIYEVEDENGNVVKRTETANNRLDLTSKMYDLAAKTGTFFGK